MSCGSRINLPKVLKAIFSDFSQKESVMLLAFLFHVDSSACDTTSRPVETVVSNGTEIVNSESKSAVFGYRSIPVTEYFLLEAWSQMVPNEVTSAPVPAVVGIAIIGILFPFTKGF